MNGFDSLAFCLNVVTSMIIILGDMNTFQLSNIGVTTWFHAGANTSSATIHDAANIPSTSSATLINNATKG